jgi:peptidoglycan/xylan/chitin deacetylase (PgdA/CDA1 family)
VTALDPSKYNPDRSFPAKIKRRLTLWRVAKPMPTTPRKGIISFTFDDFPKSAAQHGAEAMDMIGASATYYTCTGMAGHTNVMGDIFTADDIAPLIKAGHEIGTHTETHLDCARVDTETMRSEISTNAANLEAIIGKTPEPHFAWPYGETHFSGKSSIGDIVSTARGILPGINRKGSDLMQLRSFELTPEDWTTDRASKAIEQAARSGGWVTIFTHDVRKDPSAYGTTPAALQRLAKQASDSGADVLNISAAYEKITGEAVA